MVQEDLEDLFVAVTDFKRIGFTLTRHDHAHDVHSEVGPGVRLKDLVSLHGKPSLGTRIALHAALVQKPEVNSEVLQKCPDQFHKLFSLFFILANWPRTRYFESKTRILKPPHQCTVPCLQLAVVSEVSMKLPAGPMTFISLFRM
jgi:hypothetical protein